MLSNRKVVIGLSLEILQSIQAAEAKAEEMRSDAQREARDMIKSMESVCVAQERSAAIEHRALYQQLMDQDRQRVEAQLAQNSQELARQRAALCKDAEKRLDQAATQIFERIVNHGHC